MDRDTLTLLHSLLRPYDGQPSTAGDAFKIVDVAIAIETRRAIDAEGGVVACDESAGRNGIAQNIPSPNPEGDQ